MNKMRSIDYMVYALIAVSRALAIATHEQARENLLVPALAVIAAEVVATRAPRIDEIGGQTTLVLPSEYEQRDAYLRTAVIENLIVTASAVLPDTTNGTPQNVPNTLVLRDSLGSFSAQDISADGNLWLPATTATTGQLEIDNVPVLHAYGDQNIFVGAQAGNFTLTGTGNVAVGYQAAQNTNSTNVIALGGGAFQNATAPSDIIAIGVGTAQVLDANPAIAIGSFAMQNALGATDCIAIGYGAMQNAEAFSSIALGDGAMQNAQGGGVVAIGFSTLDGGGLNSVGVGDYALHASNVHCNDNCAIGWGTLRNTTADGITGLQGCQNVALGTNTLSANTTGSQNTGLGYAALNKNTSGGGNIGVGCNAAATVTTGSYNVVVGYQAASSYTGSESNNIIIGANIAGTNGESNVCRIGNIQGKTVTGVAVLVSSSNQLGVSSSSARYKTNITALAPQAADIIDRLRPVQFNYKDSDGQPLSETSYGLIAEDVSALDPSLVWYTPEGLPETVRYHYLDAFFIAKMQALQREIDLLKSQKMDQEKIYVQALAALYARIAALEKRIGL